MKRRNQTARRFLKAVLYLTASIWIFSGVSFVAAQSVEPDMNKLIQETQKMLNEDDRITMVWWLPEEYWKASLKQGRAVTNDQIDQYMQFIRPYTFFVIVHGEVGSFGGISFASETDLRQSIRLIDSEGKQYHPLSSFDIDSNTQNLLSIMKPLFASMLGPLGENMHFFLFDAKDSYHNKFVSATDPGKFYVKLGQKEFCWRTPIGALLPEKTCPYCGEKLSGAYLYCPYDGTKLNSQ